MQERLNEYVSRIVKVWNRYSKKQKTVILSVVAVIALAIGILSFVLSKTNYVVLIKLEDTKSASEVIDLLKTENIDCELGSDHVSVLVDEANYTDAVLLVGKNDIPSTGMSYTDAFNNDMSTSESEKKLKFNLALQNSIKQSLINMDGIQDATVYINAPIDNYTILTESAQTSVSVILTLEANNAMNSENATYIASWLANSVGNKDTSSISIIDNKGSLLFGGSNNNLLGGAVNSTLEYKQKLTNEIINNVKVVLLKMGSYKDVEVGAANIKYDMDKVTELYTEYTPAEGQDQGVLSNSYTYKTEGTVGSGGTPGTDANDDTEYQVGDTTGTGSKSETEKYEYLPNELKVTKEHEIGAVVPNESSMAIVLTSYKVYRQEDLERQGKLQGTSWEDFILENDVKVEQEVADGVYDTVAMTTGIAKNKLQITAWEQPIFEAKVVEPTDLSNVMMVVLAVLILGFIIFVVFKATKPVEVTETEPELSVEELLASTKENQMLEDIELGDKSETRRLIEKFVEDNPEAVALLLRNWLNDDWG